jgi:hypothetical protein
MPHLQNNCQKHIHFWQSHQAVRTVLPPVCPSTGDNTCFVSSTNSSITLMCSMSVHYIIQKTLNTNKCTKSFFVNYNTLLHVSTLLGHPQGETFHCHYTRLHYTVEWECAVDCALCHLWRREPFMVSACSITSQKKSMQTLSGVQSSVKLDASVITHWGILSTCRLQVQQVKSVYSQSTVWSCISNVICITVTLSRNVIFAWVCKTVQS